MYLENPPLYSFDDDDVRKLKFQCRPGIVFGISFWLIASVVALPEVLIKNGKWESDHLIRYGLLISGFALAGLFLFWLFARKYIADLKYKQKVVEEYKIDAKDWAVDYEAGSGIINSNMTNEMIPFNAFYVFINGHSYRVDEFFYSAAAVGDKVFFICAAVSGHRLKMALMTERSWVCNKIDFF